MSSTKIGEVNGVMVHFLGHQSLKKLLSKLSHTAKFERRKILTMARVPLQKGIGSFSQYLTLVPLDDNDDDADDNN